MRWTVLAVMVVLAVRWGVSVWRRSWMMRRSRRGAGPLPPSTRTSRGRRALSRMNNHPQTTAHIKLPPSLSVSPLTPCLPLLPYALLSSERQWVIATERLNEPQRAQHGHGAKVPRVEKASEGRARRCVRRRLSKAVRTATAEQGCVSSVIDALPHTYTQTHIHTTDAETGTRSSTDPRHSTARTRTLSLTPTQHPPGAGGGDGTDAGRGGGGGVRGGVRDLHWPEMRQARYNGF